MSLQFILGNSGSGKTDTAYRRIVAEAGHHILKNYLIIVPEQFTMQTQQKLVELAPNKAIMNIDVLSFKRLAYRVFDDLGMNDIQVLEETGKNLVLRKVAEEKKDQLTVMNANISRIGYIDELKSLLSELVQYNITPDRLEEYSRNPSLSPAFSAKLQDVVTMYRGFRKYLQGDSEAETFITAEEILHVLIRVADQSQLLKDSVIVLDEFTGFTPVQNLLIRRILPLADRLMVILTIDSRENPYRMAGEHELFALTRKTVQQLTRMAEELGITTEKPVILGESQKKRFAGSADLAFLEQQLFRPWFKIYKEEPEHIHMASLQNPKEELIYAAREINRLVQEEHFRYRDIAVVTGAVDTYSGYVDQVFSKYRIPYFLDQTTAVLFHPFTESIRAALQIVEEDFAPEAVMRFLRCGMSGLPEDQLDQLDNYLHATGIKGRYKWMKNWERHTRNEKNDDLDLLNGLRAQILGWFDPLCAVFAGSSHTVSEQIRELYRLIVTLHMEEQLWKKEEELLEQGQQVRAGEYGQLYPVIMELLEKFSRLLGDSCMDIDTFAQTLDAGMSAAKVSTIPPGYDSVTIGDIERTRLNHVQILFFIGVNDGVIPKANEKGGIISEFEREMMQEASLELAPGAREQAFIQRFYLYRSLTKPAGRLYISYARTDCDGKAQRPSYLAGALQRLFPAMKVDEQENLNASINLSAPEAAMDYLIGGEQDDKWLALAACFLREDADQVLADRTESVLRARFDSYQEDPISRITAEKLYGRSLKGSVTRLEKYRSCAYAHFLTFGLQLQDREESGFESVDIGNLYHEALKKYSLKLEASEWNWFGIPDAERDELAVNAMQEAVAEYHNVAAFDTAQSRHQTSRMEMIFRQTIWALTEQVRAGRFVPHKFELSFDDMHPGESLRLPLEAGHEMELHGRIDRMDLMEEEGRSAVKVVDYKSGSQELELNRIYHGLMLQLMVYLDTAMQYVQEKKTSAEVVPGAVFYYNIDDPVIKETGEGELTEEEVKQQLLEALRPGGLVNSEEAIYRGLDENFEKKSLVAPISLNKNGSLTALSKAVTAEDFSVIREYVMNCLKDAGREIYAGNVAVKPYQSKKANSCAYCPYGSICRISSHIPGFEPRKIADRKKDEILEAMRTANAESAAGKSTSEENSEKKPENETEKVTKKVTKKEKVTGKDQSDMGKEERVWE